MLVTDVVGAATPRKRRHHRAWIEWLDEATDPVLFAAWQP